MATLKAHLTLSGEPLTFSGQSMQGLCGATLAHAEPVMMVEIQARGLPEFNSLRDCGKCVEMAEHHPEIADEWGRPGLARRLYLYAIVPGQEAQQYRGDCVSSLEDAVTEAEGEPSSAPTEVSE